MTTGKKHGAHTVGYLTTVEAANYLGVSTQFLEQDRTTRRQGIVYYKFGVSVRYRMIDLDAWASSHRQVTTPL
jgi:excisionase family DNA binding protein